MVKRCMETNRNLEKLCVTNPELAQKVFEDPNVKSSQKMLEEATNSMEQYLKCSNKPPQWRWNNLNVSM